MAKAPSLRKYGVQR